MKTKAITTIMITLFLASILVIPVAATDGFMEDFSSATLDPNWEVWKYGIPRSWGETSYSLTDHPGYLRYYPGTLTAQWHTVPMPPYYPSIHIHRTFQGIAWVLETKITYYAPYSNALYWGTYVKFGTSVHDGSNLIGIEVWSNDGVDHYVRLMDNGVQKALVHLPIFGYSTTPVWPGYHPLPYLDTLYYKIIRSGYSFTVQWSHDGISYTTAFTETMGSQIDGLPQFVDITGQAFWSHPSAYSEHDYVHVILTPFLDKALESSTANLGDHVTATLTVQNPYPRALELKDTLPTSLRYIPGTFMVDGSPVTPTVDKNVISTPIAAGHHTVTFDMQVVEAPATAETYTNLAELWDNGVMVATDSEDITINPYAGFIKEVIIVYEKIIDGKVSVGELVQWDLTITVPNNFAWGITDAVLSDNLGGELGMAGDGIDNDKDGLTDEGGADDLEAAYNTIPTGMLSISTRGKTNKVHFAITGIDVPVGTSQTFVLGIFTDKNPSGKQCYTFPGTYELNSGAVLKFIDPITGFQLSAHTPPITIVVYP